MHPTIPELLAPAGTPEALRAAVANGADAVYFGVEALNARARAENFRIETLGETMAWLRARGVKGFLTLNVLVFADELNEAARILAAASSAGVDAVLVQDLGVARLAHELVPDLPLHASTQMTLTDPNAMGHLARELGLKRIVVPREFSIADIARLGRETGVELEAFVHGAMCVAWSGQCLTSESLGGRSANRGECAQACRQPYTMVVDGEALDLGNKRYLLSPQDLAGIDEVSALVEAGVVCFKIEGRLKSAEYVANVTSAYRRALDAAIEGVAASTTAVERQRLAQSFSRGQTTGFLHGIDHQALVRGDFPKSRGLAAGEVVAVQAPYVRIRGCDVPLSAGDGVVFDNGNPERREPGGPIYEIRAVGRDLEIGMAHGFPFCDVGPGQRVWKTRDAALSRELQASWAVDARTRGVRLIVQGAAGTPLRLTGVAGELSATVESSECLETARGRGLDRDLLAEKLGRFGGTTWHLDDLQNRLSGALALPVSALNRLRRALVEALDAHAGEPPARRINTGALQHLRARPWPDTVAKHDSGDAELSVFCRSEAQVRAACGAGVARVYADFEDPRGFRGSVAVARETGTPVYLATPRIIKPGELGFLRKLAGYAPDGVLVRNLGGLLFYRENHPEFDLVGDFSLNCANDLAARELLDLGLRLVTPAYDCNAEQLEAMLAYLPAARAEIVLHQYMPMFHTEHCVFAAVLSNGADYRSCGRPCEHHDVELRDHTGAMLPVKADVGCRNTVFNGHAQSGALYLERFRSLGVRRFRLEFLAESADRVAEVIEVYRQLLAGAAAPRAVWNALKATQRLGVTRGTLDR